MHEEFIFALVAVQLGAVSSLDDLNGKLVAMNLKGADADALDYLCSSDDHSGLFAAPASFLAGFKPGEARMQVRRGSQIANVVCRDDVTGWKLPSDTKYLAWRTKPVQ
jgi:hypothetical protein